MIAPRSMLTLVIVAVLATALTSLSLVTFPVAERLILPEIRQKAATIARSNAALIEKAIAAGIPIDRLAGLDEHFKVVLANSPEIARLSLRAPGGQIYGETAAAGQAPADRGGLAVNTVKVPVMQAGAVVASVEAEIRPDVIADAVSGIWIDQAIIIFVAIFISLELFALALGRKVARLLAILELRLRALRAGRFPRGDDSGGDLVAAAGSPPDSVADKLADRHATLLAAAERVGDRAAVAELEALGRKAGIGTVARSDNAVADAVRPPLFVFMLSEELTRSFVPHTARKLAEGFGALPVEVTVGLPIALFMLIVALSQPILGPFSERVGRGKVFFWGTLLGAVGHLGAGLAVDWMAFLAFRSVTAVGYALVFVAAQGAIADHAEPHTRSRSFAVFVRAIVVAGLCGPPLGGIIADRLGDSTGFMAAAVVAVLAAAIGSGVFTSLPPVPAATAVAVPDAPATTAAPVTAAPPAGLRSFLRQPGLVGLVFLCALPAKLMLVGFCFYLVPVEMERNGYSLSVVGRLQMLYPIVMVLMVPFFAFAADRQGRRAPYVVAGAAVAGLAAFYPWFGTGPLVLALALVQLGLGQAMSIAPQSALVADYGARSPGLSNGVTLGLFRLVERLGNALGPILAATVLALAGFAAASAAIGVIVLAGAVVYLAILMVTTDRAVPRSGKP